jgi:hypothetical protein
VSALVEVFSKVVQPLRQNVSKEVATQAARAAESKALKATTSRVFKPDTFHKAGVPPQSAFETIVATVEKILPLDLKGLKHQNFVVRETGPKAGHLLEVNHNIDFGTLVPDLKVGDQLVLRGQVYHNKRTGRDGIHWTHHAKAPGDAGYIRTADGRTYQ